MTVLFNNEEFNIRKMHGEWVLLKSEKRCIKVSSLSDDDKNNIYQQVIAIVGKA